MEFNEMMVVQQNVLWNITILKEIIQYIVNLLSFAAKVERGEGGKAGPARRAAWVCPCYSRWQPRARQVRGRRCHPRGHSGMWHDLEVIYMGMWNDLERLQVCGMTRGHTCMWGQTLRGHLGMWHDLKVIHMCEMIY